VRAAAGAAVAAAAVFVPGGSPASPPKVFPNRVQVVAKEFYFALSRRTVPAGPAIVELVNFGEDEHDLRMQRVGGAHIAGTPVVEPGAYFDMPITLRVGKYILWCSIANHRALGMQATLIVTPKVPAKR
jgi:plastocyanin